MVCLVTGWTTPKQTSLMSMMGPVHCDLVASLVALSCMTWLMAWSEMLPGRCVLAMLPGRQVLIRCIDCRGGVEDFVVGQL